MILIMKLDEIEKEVKELAHMSDDMAYEKGLVLIQELKPYKGTLSRKKYKSIYNKIQEERFR